MRSLMLPVPVRANAFADGVVGLVLTKFQFLANVRIESGGKGASDGGALRVGLGEFAEQIVSEAGVAGIQASGGEAAIALQFLHELTERDAELGFDQIVFGQSGVARQFFGYVRLFRSGQLRAFHQGWSVLIFRKLARFIDESSEVFGTILQNLVIPGGRSVAGQ